MNDINKSGTTTTKEAPGSDRDREPIEVPWNYRPITGMTLHLSTNKRCDIMSESHLKIDIVLSTSEASYGTINQEMSVIIPLQETLL